MRNIFLYRTNKNKNNKIYYIIHNVIIIRRTLNLSRSSDLTPIIIISIYGIKIIYIGKILMDKSNTCSYRKARVIIYSW